MTGKILTVAVFVSVVAAGAAQARDQIASWVRRRCIRFRRASPRNSAELPASRRRWSKAPARAAASSCSARGSGSVLPTSATHPGDQEVRGRELRQERREGDHRGKIGYDGIVLANSKAAPSMNITLEQLYLALAKDVPTARRLQAQPE